LRHAFAGLKDGGFGVALLNGGKVVERAGTNHGGCVQAHGSNPRFRLIRFVEGGAEGTHCLDA